MTELEAQAMLIRAEYARDLVWSTPDPEDRFDLLYSVIRPEPELLSRTLALAEEEGVTQLAKSIARSKQGVDVALAHAERWAPELSDWKPTPLTWAS